MIDIERDNTQRKEKWYAVTDKGVIYGGSKAIVERKIKRLGAKEKTYLSDEEHRKLYFKSIGENNNDGCDELLF